MSRAVAYTAAEYLIDALKKSATFDISSCDFNILLQHASQDVKSYFQKGSKNAVDLIVKEFPDVFTLNGSNVSLTEPFLTLCAFPESAEFHPTYKCDSASETSVIECIKLILVRCGMCKCLKLFNVLLHHNNLLSDHFSGYTIGDIYAFFQKYASTFTLINDNIYVNRCAPINFGNFCDLFCEESLKKLTKTTCFLLTCFDSLHYIEVRQVISFVLSDIMNYLNMYSLIKQREIFENLPEIAMDKMGFMSLKNMESPVPWSKQLRLVLLIVCILAFEREIHVSKIGKIIQKRAPSEVTSILCDLSILEQFKYFQKLSDYFCINGDGYVKLLPSFIFPSCTFDSSLSHSQAIYITLQPSTCTAQSNDVDLIERIKNLSVLPNHNSELGNGIIGSGVLPEDSLENSTNNSVNSPAFQNHETLKNNLSGLKGSTCLINIKLRLSMIFLVESIQAPTCKNVLKSCFFVLKDVQVAFLKLPLCQQINYIKECEIYFDSLFKKGLLPRPGVPSMSCIDDKEQVLLLIVYLLINEKIMSYEKLSWWLDSRKINCAFSKLSVVDKLLYLKKLYDYLTVIGGNVSLKNSFNSINILMDSHYDILLNLSLDSQSLTVTNDECILPQKVKSQKRLPEENFLLNAHSSITEVSLNELSMPMDLFNKLQLSVIWLQKLFEISRAEDILQTLLYTMNDIKVYFLNLSPIQQQRFMMNYFQYTNSKSFSDVLYGQYASSESFSSLTEDEKALLAITHLLVQNKTMHYEKIMKELEAFEISASLCVGEAKQRFKAFKALNNYFDISEDGIVLFSSSYYSLMSVINPILIKLMLKKYVAVNDSNNNVEDSAGHFVYNNVECILPSDESSQSVTSKKNESTNTCFKHPCFPRMPPIKMESLKGLGESPVSLKSDSTIAPQNDVLNTDPGKVSQAVKKNFLNFSIENTLNQNLVSDTSQAGNNKRETEIGDSSISLSDSQCKTYKRSVANFNSSLSHAAKNIFNEIKCDDVLNHKKFEAESENAKISSIGRNCDRSHDDKLKQNLNLSSMQDNTSHQSFVEDSDNKDVVSSDDDLDPYTLYGLELLNSILGESGPNISSCADHDVKSQTSATPYNYDCPITNRKVSNGSSNSCGALRKDTETNNELIYNSAISRSNVPLKQFQSFEAVEIQTVNFFTVILGNYQSGVSAEFLMQHLNWASENVKNFMLSSFQSNALSFFMRHKAVFYVSPATKNIYLLKNS